MGKLEPFDNNLIKNYPLFANPSIELSVGTSLCRLGYPLHNVGTSWDETSKIFQLAPDVLPLPRFPMDGIYTRMAISVDKQSGREIKFIETSTPGLKGQSGGPIFDIHGKIWGLQSRTFHFPLGFNPRIKIGNKEFEEHQFINVGIGTHVEEIIKFLQFNNVHVTVGK